MLSERVEHCSQRLTIDLALSLNVQIAAYQEERKAVLAALPPSTAAANLKQWVDACGRDVTADFFRKEPILLAYPPAELLRCLEALSTTLDLPPEKAVM